MKGLIIKKQLRADPFILRLALPLSLVYGLVYYWSAGFISFSSKARFKLNIIHEPLSKLWQNRGPFLWEPIAQVEIPFFGYILISVPNLLLGLILTMLVFANLTLLIMTLRHPSTCSLKSSKKSSRLAALFPSLFAGFGCCAPSIALLWLSLFGNVSTLLILASRWMMPLGLLLLIINILYSYKSLRISPSND